MYNIFLSSTIPVIDPISKECFYEAYENWAIELDGEKLYGGRTKKDLYFAMQPQIVRRFRKSAY